MSRRFRKLTFLSDAPHFGGAERYIVDMASAAARRGIEPHIHWMPLPNGDTEVFTPSRAGTTRVTRSSTGQTRTWWGMIRAMRRMLQNEKPDGLVINAAGRPRFWLTPWVAQMAKVPCVWVHQMVDAQDPRRLTPKWLGGCMEGPQLWRIPQTARHRLAATAATHLITLNAEDRERIIRRQCVQRNRIHVVPHGVDTRRFVEDEDLRHATRRAWWGEDHRSETSFVVGTAGRLVTGKRVDLLIQAAAILRDRDVNVRCVIAGRGPEREALERRVQKAALQSRVTFVDFVEEMPAFHNALDAFVLCSETESFGLVLSEAMACRRPVVATPTAGALHQIRHGSNGILLEGFEPSELADALQRLSKDSNRRHAMGERGRRLVEQCFSIELTLDRTLNALCPDHVMRYRQNAPRVPYPAEAAPWLGEDAA